MEIKAIVVDYPKAGRQVKVGYDPADATQIINSQNRPALGGLAQVRQAQARIAIYITSGAPLCGTVVPANQHVRPQLPVAVARVEIAAFIYGEDHHSAPVDAGRQATAANCLCFDPIVPRALSKAARGGMQDAGAVICCVLYTVMFGRSDGLQSKIGRAHV